MIFGYGFQIMFGFVAGEGFESIRLSYADRPISHTVYYGCSDMSILQSIKYYEGHYANSYRVQTKPPGYLVGHKIFGKLILLLTDSDTIEECFYNYTLIGSYLFPLLATLVIIPITYLAKILFKMKYPLLPGMIYILTPSFMIWVMVVDQVAFPFIFISVLIAMYLSIKHNSILIAAGAGVLAYLAIFISFAMLPTLGLYFLWLAAVFFTRNNNMNFYSVVKLFSGFIVGFALMYILFYYSLNYDAYHRYQLAANHHRLIKDYTVSLRTIRNAFVNNSVELFTWIGIPIFFLVASFCVKSATKVFNKTSELQDLFSISCAGMYIALNVLSNTHGEVQRMWLFLSPPMVIIAAAELVNRIKDNKKLAVLLLLIIQFCTAVLHYQFIRTQYF